MLSCPLPPLPFWAEAWGWSVLDRHSLLLIGPPILMHWLCFLFMDVNEGTVRADLREGIKYLGLPWWLSGKEPACSAGDAGDVGSIPVLGRCPGVGNVNPQSILTWKISWTTEA